RQGVKRTLKTADGYMRSLNRLQNAPVLDCRLGVGADLFNHSKDKVVGQLAFRDDLDVSGADSNGQGHALDYDSGLSPVLARHDAVLDFAGPEILNFQETLQCEWISALPFDRELRPVPIRKAAPGPRPDVQGIFLDITAKTDFPVLFFVGLPASDGDRSFQVE